MDSDDEQGYKPPPEFQLEAKEPLIDLSSTDSTELWLIRLPPRKPVSFILWYMRAQFLGRKTKKKQYGSWLLTNFNCHVKFIYFSSLIKILSLELVAWANTNLFCKIVLCVKSVIYIYLSS